MRLHSEGKLTPDQARLAGAERAVEELAVYGGVIHNW